MGVELFDDTFDFCDYSTPGIKKIQIADYTFYTPFNQDATTKEITGFTITIPQATMDNTYKTCNFTEVQTKQIQEQTLTIIQTQLDQDKQNVLKKLTDRDIVVMFLDANNKGQLFNSRIAALTESQSTTGIASGENQYTLTIKSKSDYQVRRIADDYMEYWLDCSYCDCPDYYAELALTSTVDVTTIQECYVDDFDGTQ